MKILKTVKKITIIVHIAFAIIAIVGFIFILSNLGIVNLDNIGGTSSIGGSIDLTVTDVDLKTLMAMSDSEVWELLTGGAFSSKPGRRDITESEMNARMQTITIPIRTENGDSTTTVKVNVALANLFTAFFNDLYTNCPDFYIKSVVGYSFRANVNNTSVLSSHAFGAAVDINPDENPNNSTPPSSKTDNYTIYTGSKMVEVGKKYTLYWGGYYKKTKDPMHFSFIGDNTRAGTLNFYGSN